MIRSRLLRRTAIRSRVAAGSGIPPAVRVAVRLRDASHCRRCDRWLANVPSSIHHRLPRSRGGQALLSTLVSLCGTGTTGCHGEIESHRTQAYTDGWLVRTGQNPADIPMVTVSGSRLWLDDAGGQILDDGDRS